MICGVRFCGGCNSRYNRGQALKALKETLAGQIDFSIAEEGAVYDVLLVIGGCSNCCAGYEQFQSRKGVLRMWEPAHMDSIALAIINLKMEDEEIGLEADL